jgi:hypothetical protein
MKTTIKMIHKPVPCRWWQVIEIAVGKRLYKATFLSDDEGAELTEPNLTVYSQMGDGPDPWVEMLSPPPPVLEALERLRFDPDTGQAVEVQPFKLRRTA